ncbi:MULTISPECIES: chemotaxis protein CheW [unclassified Coleofasciculus]|uniref:chemotaxis protein CheW n=1 Tax=unclassified Coleofasciculus TaxID=2692782 RepID=UPI00187F470D|nr:MULTISPECIES: chemotaxis protein CheW [unclassified Coleofasciculus]MBE9125621.1 chemotaxis protein CheW [Coleofasciculus sp. LEGE 07081]MBE9147335.1 chemotaxis protein CheW [Coleofasciculus sp. LEGE 07092]
MKDNSYLVFGLNTYLYGIQPAYVEEIFLLPELIHCPEAPPEIVGAVNLRGDRVPVVDLNLTFGNQVSDYRLTDSVIVLRGEQFRVGIIVNEVYEVKIIDSEDSTPELSTNLNLAGVEDNKHIAQFTRRAGDILIFSSPENWLPTIETQQFISLDQNPVYFSNFTLEEQVIFQQRSDNLKLSVDSQDLSLKPLAVIILNDNLLGIDLAVVREFTDIRQVTPIPCCPPHIIGNMNLRGEILTLVDIRGLLNLPVTAMTASSKAMVVEIEGIVAGVMVETIRDAMFLLNSLEIKAVPTATYLMKDKYIQGAASYDKKKMGILDLPKLFQTAGLIVDEAV